MRSSYALMLFVFAVTLFVSAFLLFLVQPMVGKMILPLLGGNPAVWNTCMVFFQAALLAGYAYAHATSRWLGPRKQAAMHLALLIIPVVVLPISVNKELAPEGESNPVLGVLLLLVISAGLPFFVVSASAPLLQKWFADTGHPAARDPYFLYGASNLGSMLALVGYPFLVEPNLTLQWQRWAWGVGYGVLALLAAWCALLLWRSPKPAPVLVEKDRPRPNPPPTAVTKRRRDRQVPEQPAGLVLMTPAVSREVTMWRRLHWVALAFVPSSLMLGATTYITTDIAAIPLLWVIPLAVYLLSFILVFSRLPELVHKLMILALPLVILLLAVMMVSDLIKPKEWAFIIWHIVALFVVAMVCHGELARLRPDAGHLTEFYLLMSVGGVLGGLFNALVAPLVFPGIVEYQLAMVLACILLPRFAQTPSAAIGSRFDLVLVIGLGTVATLVLALALRHKLEEAQDNIPGAASEASRLAALLAAVLTLTAVAALGYLLVRRTEWQDRWFDVALPILLGLLVASLIWGLPAGGWSFEKLRKLLFDVSGERINLGAWQMYKVFMYILPAVLCYIFVERSERFGLAVGAFLLVCGVSDFIDSDRIHQERSFFGVLSVRSEEGGAYHKLIHGTTVHGKQARDSERRFEPLTYYHRTGPVGQIFAAYPQVAKNYAVVGLGTGTMAAYCEEGDHVTFYEIDRRVRELAQNDDYFTYVNDCRRRGGQVDIVLGDARLQLEKANPPEKYRLIVVDAFSSDAIPVHLITREAVRIFFDKVAEDGIVAYHISNRYLRLEPVLANLAQAEGLTALVESDGGGDGGDKYASTWVVLARKPEYLAELPREPKSTVACLSLVQKLPAPTLAAVALMYDGILERRSWWQPLVADEKSGPVGVWTDDYSNLVTVFEWTR